MRDLNTMFPDAKGYATRANAEKKLAFAKLATDSNDLHLVLQRPSDGKWLPIVIIGSRSELNPMSLAQNNICVTNV